MSHDMTEADARIEAAAAVLQERLVAALSVRRVDQAAMHIARTIIRDHRTQARGAGIDFPAVVVMPFPRQGRLKIFNAELGRKDIETLIVNLTVEMPTIRPDEIAMAVHFAFPQYRDQMTKVH